MVNNTTVREIVFSGMKHDYHLVLTFPFSCFYDMIFFPSHLSEQRKFTVHSPDASSGTNSNGITNPCIRSPYIDGCSPIKNWSPMRLEMYRGGTQYRTSLIQIPFTLETQGEDEEDKETIPSPAMDAAGIHLQQFSSEASTHGTHLVVTAVSVTQNQSSASEKELALLQDVEREKDNNTVDMVDPIEIADENTWIKEPVDNGSLPMTDFVSGIAFSIENSHMCMSPLAESSVIPCESSNIQVRYLVFYSPFLTALVFFILSFLRL